MYKEISHCFNLAKSSYPQHDNVQRQVTLTLQQLMYNYMKYAHSVLELGCGNGIDSFKLFKILNSKRYDAIDCAVELITEAKCISKLDARNFDRLNFYCTNFDLDEMWMKLAGKKYHLIYSNMALQWSCAFSLLLYRIQQTLEDNGYFCFSIPLKGTFNELEQVVRINHFYNHIQVLKMLQKNGLVVITAKCEKFVVAFDDRISQLRHLKYTGVNCYLGDSKVETLKLRCYLQQDECAQLTYLTGLYILKKRTI
ncbi:methyltransferase domain-containing protein [Fastidiosibacter lacustris]|uniref:methyltransferase domain-containing protein n=1 Tax=Fastidiosibacter lacustris TaxID=2056695 RepID=UPI0013004B88|nr:methyltransferase domain-containing protein [Fastidiosibacter lacustris]